MLDVRQKNSYMFSSVHSLELPVREQDRDDEAFWLFTEAHFLCWKSTENPNPTKIILNY